MNGKAPKPPSQSNIQQIWTRIETWLAANAPDTFATLSPGATGAALAEAEAYMGVTFPADVRESYRIHNGQTSDDEGYAGLMESKEFLSLSRIRGEWAIWKELLDGGIFAGTFSAPPPGVKGDWWNPAWIPITSDGGGNHDCLDLDPAPGGEAGQIIAMWHDDSVRPILAPSFTAWLARFADDLEAGEYVLSDEYGMLVRKDDV